MWWMSILNWVTGSLADKVLDGYKAKLDQGANADKLAADLATKEIEAHQRIALAELGSWFTSLPRVVIEMSIATYIAKVIVWDICLGLGSTDAIRGAVGVWAGIVVTGMFGAQITNSIVKKLINR